MTLCVIFNCLYSIDTGADFLKFGIGARPSAMGECAVALYSDIFATYWNPAGLSKIEKREFGIMHGKTVMDASLEFLGFAYPTKKSGTFGISSIFFIPEPVPVTTTDENTEGELNWLDWALALSYGKDLQKIAKNLSTGGSFKLIQRRERNPFFRSKGTAYAVDIGFIYRLSITEPFLTWTEEKLSFGISILNLGSKIKMSGETTKDDLPRTLKMGCGYKMDLSKETHLTLVCDINKLLSERLYFGTGIETKFRKTIAVRAGYLTKEGNIKGVTYGFGLEFKNYQIDYSNVPASEMIGFERDNRFSFIIRF